MTDRRKRFSLMDLAVRRLVEIYHKWDEVKDIEAERDALLLEREDLIARLNETQQNYNDMTMAAAIQLIRKR